DVGGVGDDNVMMEMKVVAGGCGGCGDDVGSVVLNGSVVEVIDLVVTVVGGWWQKVGWRCWPECFSGGGVRVEEKRVGRDELCVCVGLG
ncbi:hypothetical protein Tco_1189384, partial [Tanacetum coccineum]